MSKNGTYFLVKRRDIALYATAAQHGPRETGSIVQAFRFKTLEQAQQQRDLMPGDDNWYVVSVEFKGGRMISW